MSNFPPVPKELLTALEEIFPDRMPLTSDYVEILKMQGQQRVVGFLRHQFEEQNKNILGEKN